MPTILVNQVALYYELTGASGESLVLVHGSWADHTAWQLVVPGLAASFRVLTYDRRGHGRSHDAPSGSRRTDDEADLAGLIEALDLAPVHVIGNSFGASIAFGLAANRPDLIASISGHEPPLTGVIAADPEMTPALSRFHDQIDAIVHRLETGDILGGARQFIDEVAFGPGAWDLLPSDVQATITSNAMTFVDETRDPDGDQVDVNRLARLTRPVLLTQGERSLPWFPRIVAALQAAMPLNATTYTFDGAGHAPHGTHPQQYVHVVGDFARSAATH